jgi:hypothetical protein
MTGFVFWLVKINKDPGSKDEPWGTRVATIGVVRGNRDELKVEILVSAKSAEPRMTVSFL